MSTLSKVCWSITAILFIITGIVCFCFPGATLVGISIYLGISLLVSGIGTVATYFTSRKVMLNSGWILVGGITTVILGIFVLANSSIVNNALPIMFSMWVIILGILRISASFDLKKLTFKAWWVDLVLGIILILLGTLALFKPIINVIIITVFTGLFFIFNGITMFSELYFACKVEKRAKNVLDKMNSIVVEPENVRNTDIPNE